MRNSNVGQEQVLGESENRVRRLYLPSSRPHNLLRSNIHGKELTGYVRFDNCWKCWFFR